MNRTSRFVVLALLLASAVQARVISYAPYTDRSATPAVQQRTNRHFLLLEQVDISNFICCPPPSPLPPNYYNFPPSQAVLYDADGLQEPRVVFPQDGSSASISVAAVCEDERNIPAILVQTDANFVGNNPQRQFIWLLSSDGGKTWMKVDLPTTPIGIGNVVDTGGFFVRGRYSQVRIGTREVPFVVAATSGSSVGLYAVTTDASVRKLAEFQSSVSMPLIGSDRTGTRFLYQTGTTLLAIDLNGNKTTVGSVAMTGLSEGWITPDGAAYVEQVFQPGQVVLYYSRDGMTNPVAASWEGGPAVQPPTINPSWVFFAVPTADYSGAWMIRRGGGRATELLLHKPDVGVVSQWRDVSAPEVEALHASAAGDKVLIQVHRPRQSVDNLMFKDPALAVWHVGDPAPRSYDELFLSESITKAFVHLDVDAIESGDLFVFDSGIVQPGGNIIISPAPPSGGGSDVVQEWGVVRASLRQQLVLPGVGRTAGAYGSNWTTDVTFYNPSDTGLELDLRYAPNGSAPSAFISRSLTLAPNEIRQIVDIVGTLWGYQNTTGALYVTPELNGAVNVTSHTYNKTPNGTYGFTMNGIDVYTAVGPRFPLTFSGAFQGSNFRTNVIVNDVSERGVVASLFADGPNGSFGDGTRVDTYEGAQVQVNSVADKFGLPPTATGALAITTTRGQMLASVFVVDNRTNDPTFFPPDIPASVMRIIPAIGHIDGANGSKFRSDLFLYNVASFPKTLILQAKLWDVPEQPTTLTLTLLGHEARVIRDVLSTAFGKTGIARLRYTLQGSSLDTSVRVTSRTYTIDPTGGTYGFLMPPLNAFQSGGAGDTLEILGATLDPHFRTNLGLVDLTGFPGPRPARARIEIIDQAGSSLDSFEISIPSAGGMQINDLFHGRALPENANPVLIRITTIEGMIGAYAAFVDNGTNDPAYVAANLAAKN